MKFELRGQDSSLVDFQDFAVFTRAVTDTLAATHRRLNPEPQKRPRFNITHLSISSAICEVAPASSFDAPLLDEYVGALSAIRSGRMPVGKLSGEDLREYRKLGRVLESKTEFVRIADIDIDDQFVSNCDRLLECAPRSFGEVIGNLDGVNIHNRKFFRIYPEGQNTGAECTYPDELYDRLINAFGTRVRLIGEIRRNPDGIGVDHVRVESMEELPSKEEVPSLTSLRGAWIGQPPVNVSELRASWND